MDTEQNTPLGPGDRSKQVPPNALLFLAGLVVGALLLAAMSKGDIDKAIWFCVGTAITGVASACQAYASRMQASEERSYSERVRIQEHTLKIRLDAYEDYLRCCNACLGGGFSNDSVDIYFGAHVRLQLVACDAVAAVSKEMHAVTAQLQSARVSRDMAEADKKQLARDYGSCLAKIIKAMRDDIGRSGVMLCSISSVST